MVGAFPLAVINILEVQRFSMFPPAPLIALVLFVILWLPGTQRLILEQKNL